MLRIYLIAFLRVANEMEIWSFNEKNELYNKKLLLSTSIGTKCILNEWKNKIVQGHVVVIMGYGLVYSMINLMHRSVVS